MADGYLERVTEAYQGEVFGEAIFAAMAARADDPEAVYKWRVLGRLEAETKERLKPLVAALGGEVREDPAGVEKGARLAEKWSQQSWGEIMGWFQAELPKYVRFFEKLEADARAEDRELLARVTAHEVALEEFAALEVAGRVNESLEPVLALLDRPPPRNE